MKAKTLMEEIKVLTEKEVEEILVDAKKNAEKIVREAEEEADRIKELKIKEKTSEMENLKTMKLAATRLEGRRKILGVKSLYVDQVSEKAEKELKRIAEKRGSVYVNSLKTLLMESIENLGSKNLLIFVNERDKETITKIIREVKREIGGLNVKLKLASESINTIGGLIVQSADEKQIYNSTFEARLSRLKDKLRGDILNILFGGR